MEERRHSFGQQRSSRSWSERSWRSLITRIHRSTPTEKTAVLQTPPRHDRIYHGRLDCPPRTGPPR